MILLRSRFHSLSVLSEVLSTALSDPEILFKILIRLNSSSSFFLISEILTPSRLRSPA